MKQKLGKVFLNTMSNDPSNWKGVLYYNKRDPRLIVPKINPSSGWTLNFARPITYIILVIFIFIIVGSLIF